MNLYSWTCNTLLEIHDPLFNVDDKGCKLQSSFPHFLRLLGLTNLVIPRTLFAIEICCIKVPLQKIFVTVCNIQKLKGTLMLYNLSH